MAVHHPFDDLAPGRVRVAFLPLLGVTLVVGTALLLLDPGGQGIVGLEVAGTVAAATDVMAEWDQRDVIHAAFGVGLDYLFLLAYSSTIALACVWGRRVFHHAWLITLGGVLAWAAWVGAALDAIENVALLDMIRGPVASPAPQIAATCAYVKFLLVYAGVLYALAAGLTRLARRAP